MCLLCDSEKLSVDFAYRPGTVGRERPLWCNEIAECFNRLLHNYFAIEGVRLTHSTFAHINGSYVEGFRLSIRLPALRILSD